MREVIYKALVVKDPSKGRLAQYLFEYMFAFLNTYGIIDIWINYM